jgi:hypothetical protein
MGCSQTQTLKEINMPVKVHFDIENSLKFAPPKKYNNARHIKRIIVKRDKVTFPLDEQTRVLSVKQTNVSEIRDSLEVNGWLHTEIPPMGYVDPNDKDRFIGISGFNRNAAMSQLEWETMIFDVYEFDTPLAKRRAKVKANHHKRPFSPNTKEDLIKQVILAIKSNEIQSDEHSIKELIDDIAEDKTEKEKNKIFDSINKRKGGSDTVRTYHTGKGQYSTQEVSSELKLPFSGDQHLKLSGELGYINSSTSPKTTLYDAKKLSSQYGGAKVAFIGFIDKPGEQPKIYQQRSDFLVKFDNFIRQDAEFVLNVLKSFNVETNIEEVLKKYPVYFKGFLPQVITPDTTKGGNPKEETLVDIDGNSV